MTSIDRRTESPACVEHADLFLHPLLEDNATPATIEQRRTQTVLAQRAEGMCLDCPLMTSCLYTAVVEHDVAGYVAGTTARQRVQMRNRLGVHVEPEDFDSFVGAGIGHQVDHEEVLRLRAANPHESLESIAQRLGCSLSTVKRHLRKARNGETVGRARLKVVLPSRNQVLDAYRDLVARPAAPRRPERTVAA